MKISNFKEIFKNFQEIQADKRAYLGLKEYTTSELPFSEKYCRLLGWVKDPKTRKWTESFESYCARTKNYPLCGSSDDLYATEDDLIDSIDALANADTGHSTATKTVLRVNAKPTKKQIATAMAILKRNNIQSIGNPEETFSKMTRKEISEFITQFGV